MRMFFIFFRMFWEKDAHVFKFLPHVLGKRCACFLFSSACFGEKMRIRAAAREDAGVCPMGAGGLRIPAGIANVTLLCGAF
ncbi:hypothetical protein Trebr_0536 [Treponema brennaborense DSM 12168]|uniref:Uncharacterized protein n=1 Tax=Treponema brennaborense (strain DSM 12168 / CIP 105900 / DD5/3) TaxID=906968 RepID=F4LPG8_TREBD|nr:hypothetical protein Trebr_0536 [Treponema brennaborense DSM 12168]